MFDIFKLIYICIVRFGWSQRTSEKLLCITLNWIRLGSSTVNTAGCFYSISFAFFLWVDLWYLFMLWPFPLTYFQPLSVLLTTNHGRNLCKNKNKISMIAIEYENLNNIAKNRNCDWTKINCNGYWITFIR